MIGFVKWAVDRTICFVAGHDLQPDRIYYSQAKSITDGFACTRCGKTQLLLFRWQEVDDD